MTKLLHVRIENMSDDVPCPLCNEKTRKEDPPNIPMPDLPESGKSLDVLGKAFCVNPDCPVCEEELLVSWECRTGEEITIRETLIPAALDGAPFYGPLDEEPDGDDDEAVKARGES